MVFRMPEVDLDRDIAACFAEARQLSAGAIDVPGEGPGQRHVTVITPGRLIMPLPCPPPDAVSVEMLVGIRRIVPPLPKLAITVIAFNDVVSQGALTPGQVNSLIPFLGYLMGMAFDGHTVVVFEGHPSALKVGCQNSNVLIVDQRMADHLQRDWVLAASTVMRYPRILVFQPDGSIAEVDISSPPPGKAEGPSRSKKPWWPFGRGI
jgi:hypothetical protein